MRYHIANWSAAVVALALSAGQSTFALAADPAEGTNMTVPQIIERLNVGPTRGIVRGIGEEQKEARQPPASRALNFRINFEFNSADLTSDAKEILDRLGQAMQSQELSPYHFRIEGHTDAVGSDNYNLHLSEQRAAAVRDYLERRFKIDNARMMAIGLGERQLLNTANPTGGENRRVVVVNIGES
jgi:OOP family OmpA-OmpF porin